MEDKEFAEIIEEQKKRQEDRDIDKLESRFYDRFNGKGLDEYNSKPQTLLKPKKLDWRVFCHDFNADKIEAVNVFDLNWPFLAMVYRANKEAKNDFDAFSKGIKHAIMHEYWARCEYEICISGLFNDMVSSEEIDRLIKERKGHPTQVRFDAKTDGNKFKIDVYTQIIMNWDPFIEYVWNNRKLISQFKKDYLDYYKRK